MKKILSILLIAFTVTLFSCKKKDPISYPLVGVWQGLYGSGTNPPSIPFTVVFNSDGKILTRSQYNNSAMPPQLVEHIGTGTYTINGATINFTYTLPDVIGSNSFNFTCTYNSQSNTMTGTFGTGTSTTGNTFNVTKQ